MRRNSITPPVLQDYYDDWHFSPAFAADNILFLSGFTGVAPDGSLSPDPQKQFEQTFETIALVLAEAGLDFTHVVEMTSYHVGLREHLKVFREVRARYVVEPYPAWTAIGVAELAVEGALVEVRVTALRAATT